MKSGLNVTKLREGEEILFGPTRRAIESAIMLKAQDDSQRVTHTSYRTVCITSTRVIVESGDRHIHYPNKEIRTVRIEYKKNKAKEITGFDILNVRTRSGITVKLDIPSVPPDEETLLAAIFPIADIKSNQGITGFLNRLFGG